MVVSPPKQNFFGSQTAYDNIAQETIIEFCPPPLTISRTAPLTHATDLVINTSHASQRATECNGILISILGFPTLLHASTQIQLSLSLLSDLLTCKLHFFSVPIDLPSVCIEYRLYMLCTVFCTCYKLQYEYTIGIHTDNCISCTAVVLNLGYSCHL